MVSKFRAILIIVFFLVPSFVFSANLGEELTFNIDKSYDLKGREEIKVVLIRITNKAYFYLEKELWNELKYNERKKIEENLDEIGLEFQRKIYPVLTSIFGSEPNPGIDRDEKITVLFHQMVEGAGGYFNPGNLYSKHQYTLSNEREMVYLNSEHIGDSKLSTFLAHEFVHLITANQKELLRGVTEEVWLNEARAEYAITLLGYDDIYKGSNLEKRVKIFLENPTNSLTEWLNEKADYGVVNLFVQYLVEHYGIKILVDSLHSDKVGIESLNYALKKNNYTEDFSNIFRDWLIALLVNNCQLEKKYCYFNQNLQDFRVRPTFYYLPKEETIFSTFHKTTYWAGNWYRLVGGGNVFTLEFEGKEPAKFNVSYLLCDLDDRCLVEFLELDKEQKRKIVIPGFRERYNSLTLISFVSGKASGFDSKEESFSFSWKVTISEQTEAEKEQELKTRLLARLVELQKKVRQLKDELFVLLANQGKFNYFSCKGFLFKNNLYYGMKNNPDVRCLQEFLKSEGPEVYPEGLITGNFFNLTREAVVRFQEKYASEILIPFGLKKATGYVGPITRAKINQLLNH